MIGGGNCGAHVSHERQFDHDPGSLAQGTLDGRRSSEQPCTFLDSFQAKVAFAHFSGVETNAPILNLDPNVIIPLGQSDEHSFTLAVASGVGKALLNDPKDDVFQRRCQPFAVEVMNEVDLRFILSTALGDKILDGGHHAKFVQDG